MRVIGIVGMGRAGSTALYNIVREICQLPGIPINAGLESEIGLRDGWINIIKTHEYNEQLAKHFEVVLTTKRDIRDVIASEMRYRPTLYSDDLSIVDRVVFQLQLHQDWRGASDYEFVYERFFYKPEEVIAEIGQVLGLSIKSDEISAKISGLRRKVPKIKSRNSTTLLHKNHIGAFGGVPGSYRSILSDAQIGIIVNTAREWLDQNGYKDYCWHTNV